MYSVLIVDDVRLMREGISKMLPWQDLGIDHVDTAESGITALARMEEHMPDILITDIEMENMDGLSLIENMNKRNPGLRIIVLTGHDDFAYVQQCCRMQVHDYILKPVEVDKLTEVIRTQVAEIVRQEEIEGRRRVDERVTGLGEQSRIESRFREFLKKRAGEDEIRTILNEYGWTPDEGFQVALIAAEHPAQAEDMDVRNELQEMSASAVCIELVEGNHHGITFRDGDGAMVIILFHGAGHPSNRDLMEQVRDVLQSEYDTTQRVYMGSVVEEISEIPDSYADAMILRDSQQMNNNLIQMQTETDRCLTVVKMLPDVTKEILDSAEDPNQAIGAYRSFCRKLSSYCLPPDFIRSSAYQMLSNICYKMNEKNGIVSGVSLTELMRQIQNSDENAVYDTGKTFLEKLFANNEGRDENVIDQVKQYVAEHLEEELSVSFLADKFHLSVAYFSKLFKKTEGVGCNYYIVCQRMQRACQMLTGTTLRLNDIADRVGYRDVKYFSAAFKKYTGMSPREYREKPVR